MRILLCDHHRLLIEALAASLDRVGHDVVAMTTEPDEAVDAAVEYGPDVCLLDVVFPGRQGVDVISRIATTTRSKVLVLSARRDGGTICAALAAGASGFVGKDQGMDEVVRSLDQVRAGELIVPPGIVAVHGHGPGHPRVPEPVGLRYLTSREREALRLIAEGQSTKEIAHSMHVAYSTARTHVQNVLTKLGVRSRLQAAALIARVDLADQLDDRPVASHIPDNRSTNQRSLPTAKRGGGGARRAPH